MGQTNAHKLPLEPKNDNTLMDKPRENHSTPKTYVVALKIDLRNETAFLVMNSKVFLFTNYAIEYEQTAVFIS